MSSKLSVQPESLLSVTSVTHEIPTYKRVEKMGIKIASNAVVNELISLLESEDGKYVSMEEYYKIVDLITAKGFDMGAAYAMFCEFQHLGRCTSWYPLLNYSDLMKKMQPWVERYKNRKD